MAVVAVSLSLGIFWNLGGTAAVVVVTVLLWVAVQGAFWSLQKDRNFATSGHCRLSPTSKPPLFAEMAAGSAALSSSEASQSESA